MDGGASGYDAELILQLIGGLIIGLTLSPSPVADEVARCAAPESTAQHVEETASFLRARCHQHRNLVLVSDLDLQRRDKKTRRIYIRYNIRKERV